MEASAAVSSLVAPLLPHLCAPNHLGALWSAVLAADAPPQTAAAAGPLAIVFCELINADGGGAGGAGGDGGQALSGLAFASDAVPRLWGSRRRGGRVGRRRGRRTAVHLLPRVLAGARPPTHRAPTAPLTTHHPPLTAHRPPPAPQALVVLEDDELLHRPFGAQQLRPLCDSLKEAALSLDWSRHERHRHRPARRRRRLVVVVVGVGGGGRGAGGAAGLTASVAPAAV